MRTVAVYDVKNNLLGTWNSAIELSEWSLTKENNLPIESAYSVGWRGCPVNYLQCGKIQKSCKYNIAYKGLFFRYETI